VVKQFATTSLHPQNWWTIHEVDNPGDGQSVGWSIRSEKMSGGQSRSGGNNHESITSTISGPTG